MRVRTLLLTTLLIPASLPAQTIRGIVVEYGARNTIAGATVEVTDRKGVVAAATSDSSGYFVVYPRTAGRMTVHATHPSFTALRTDTVTAAQKEMVTLFVRMTNSPIAIEPIVVTARSRTALNGFYERERRTSQCVIPAGGRMPFGGDPLSGFRCRCHGSEHRVDMPGPTRSLAPPRC